MPAASKFANCGQVVLLSSLALAFLLPLPCSSQTYSLDGYVVDGATGLAMPGIRLHLFSASAQENYDHTVLFGRVAEAKLADADGHFTFTGLAAHSYSLQAELPHEIAVYGEAEDSIIPFGGRWYLLSERHIDVGPSEGRTRMKLAYCTAILLLAAVPAIVPALSAQEDIEISGIVVDSQTGQPIRHARVAAGGLDTARNRAIEMLVALTGEDGKFRFTGLPQDGVYDVGVAKAGYFPDPYDKKNNLKSSSSLTLHMVHMDMVALTVTVKDASGLPVAGAEIAIAEKGKDSFEIPFFRSHIIVRPPTNVDGTFRTLLSPGRYRFSVIAPGPGSLLSAQGLTFQPLYYPGTEDLKRAESIELRSGEDVTTEIRVTPVPAREIHAHLAVEGRLTTFWVSGTIGGLSSENWGILQYEEGSRDIVVSGLAPGTYDLHFYVPTSVQFWYVKTVQVGEQLVTNVEVSSADQVR